jgi:hypothetical protein
MSRTKVAIDYSIATFFKNVELGDITPQPTPTDMLSAFDRGGISDEASARIRVVDCVVHVGGIRSAAAVSGNPEIPGAEPRTGRRLSPATASA